MEKTSSLARQCQCAQKFSLDIMRIVRKHTNDTAYFRVLEEMKSLGGEYKEAAKILAAAEQTESASRYRLHRIYAIFKD
jgi:hypothetical protein